MEHEIDVVYLTPGDLKHLVVTCSCGTWHWHILKYDEAKDHFSAHIASLDRNRPSADAAEERVLLATCDWYGISYQRLIAGRGVARQADARHVAMYIIREHLHLSYNSIGSLFQREHSTAIHGVRKVKALLETNPVLREAVEEITKRAGITSI